MPNTCSFDSTQIPESGCKQWPMPSLTFPLIANIGMCDDNFCRQSLRTSTLDPATHGKQTTGHSQHRITYLCHLLQSFNMTGSEKNTVPSMFVFSTSCPFCDISLYYILLQKYIIVFQFVLSVYILSAVSFHLIVALPIVYFMLNLQKSYWSSAYMCCN